MAANDEKKGGRIGVALFLLGLFVGVPILALCGLTIPGPPSMETILFTVSIAIFVMACLASPWRNTRVLVLISALLAMTVVAYRFFAAAQGDTIAASTGPHGGESRWIDRIAPERDVALAGVNLLIATDRMPRDRPGILDALRDGYARMHRSEGPVPSAIVGTFLFGQSPDDHSLLRIAPERFEPPEAVVLFLHGYIGSLTLACWQVAQAANPVGIDVVCPATHWSGDWTSEDGRRTVERNIEILRSQGVRRIYLAGLSQGAISISEIAPSLDVDAVILISGAQRGAPSPHEPVLVLQGRLDRMTPRGPARAYAAQSGGHYAEQPEAGHWMILSHHEWFTTELRTWLAEREGIGDVHRTPAAP
jgi:predicted esterase